LGYTKGKEIKMTKIHEPKKIDLDAKPVAVNAVTCPACKWTIFSRARHDMHSCECGGVSIDGGFDYMRGAWRPDIVGDGFPPGCKLQIEASRRELYGDWNSGADKFGKYPPECILVKLEDEDE
jgi:hypothetical protein